MNLNKDRLVNRLCEMVDEGRGIVRRVADDLGENAKDVAWKAKKEIVRGRRAMVSAEEQVARQAKDHPVAFVLLGCAIASLVAATFILNSDRRK